MGWTKQQIEVYIAHLRRQLHDTGVHAYCLMRAVWPKKPELKGNNDP